MQQHLCPVINPLTTVHTSDRRFFDNLNHAYLRLDFAFIHTLHGKSYTVGHCKCFAGHAKPKNKYWFILRNCQLGLCLLVNTDISQGDLVHHAQCAAAEVTMDAGKFFAKRTPKFQN